MAKGLTNRSKQALATKKRIITAGKRLITKKGFDNVSVDEISKAADITVGTFYYYFKSKDELIFEMLPKIHDYFESEEAKNAQHESYFTQITLYFSSFSKFIEKDGIKPEVLREIFKSDQLLKQIDSDRLLPGMELIMKAQLSGEITNKYSASTIAHNIFYATRGICLAWSMEPKTIELYKSVLDVVERLTRSYLTINEDV